MTIASAPASLSRSIEAGRVPGSTVSTSSPQVIGSPDAVQQPDMPVTPGTTWQREAAPQTDVDDA